VFLEDAWLCPKCAGPMRWLEVASEPDDIAHLLARHGLAPVPRTRAPPKGQLLAFGRERSAVPTGRAATSAWN